MNLNKLFPRLRIRTKLAIAFVALAVGPLILVGYFGTRSALSELRETARSTLEHDMTLAHSRTARSLREIGQHATFLAETAARGVLTETEETAVAEARRIARTYLTADSSALFRVKVLDASGTLRLVESIATDVRPVEVGDPGEMLYQISGMGLAPHGRAILPVELRSVSDSLRVVPAIAVVTPVMDGGENIGTVIGEAYADRLFSGLESVSPGLAGSVTGLVGENGTFLYHTEAKNDWASIFVGASRLSLSGELGEEAANRIVSEASGLISLEDGREIAFRRIEPPQPGDAPIVLYRALPKSVLEAGLRSFVVAFGGLGLVLVFAVLGISVLAAQQLTRPIYALGASARQLAVGEQPPPLSVETNDELEDLAHDFNLMARALADHRTRLETLVEERTRQLVRTETHFEQVVTDAADAIIALDPDGKIDLWNKGAEELFGYAADEALGRTARDLLGGPPPGQAGEEGYMNRVLNEVGKVVNHRSKRRHRDGTWIPVTITGSELHDEQGQVQGHSVIIRDDRARETLEEQMRRSERLAAISVMAGGIAHELNNPLSVLGNRIELMQREASAQGLDPRMMADFEVLRTHVGRIGSITADLLRFARDDSDELGAVDVNSVVGRVTRLMRKVIASAGLELDVALDERLPQVHTNDTIVETILVNLLLNAQQATPTGGAIRIETRRAKEDTAVEIEVSDTGPGIPEELRRRVFEPFFTTKAEHGGTGLGLAVCRAMVERLGGQIALMNGDGTGAHFVLTLPRTPEDMHV